MSARTLPYQHLSIRVPWQDRAWTGTVCDDPLANGSCLRLGRIAEERNDALQVLNAGKSWNDLPEQQLPPCSAERAGFMSSTPRTVTKRHPYAAWNETYKKFTPTQFDLPAYSADCVPFRWMLREYAVELADRLQLPYQTALEDAVDQEANLNGPSWVQHADNQQLLLDTFFSAVTPQKTLAFFYAKATPVSDDPRRILVGVGRVLTIAKVVPYRQAGGGFGSVLWERVVRHSIRSSMEDGFLLPYQALLKACAADGTDVADYAVHVPDEYSDQFSYATEHVGHDTALELLLALDTAVVKAGTKVAGNWQLARNWISERLGDVWKARGPFPGLGAALTAFGVADGVLMAYAVHGRVGDNADPWPLVDDWLRDPTHADESFGIGGVLSRTWQALSAERLALLKLLARFDLSTEQATRMYQVTERLKAGLQVSDAELLPNPYLLYEKDRFSREAVTVAAVDRGVFPDDVVRRSHPLPSPSKLTRR